MISRAEIPRPSWTPCVDAGNPVNIDTWEGSVQDEGAMTFSYLEKPRPNKLWSPFAKSSRNVSATTKITFGLFPDLAGVSSPDWTTIQR